MEALTRLVTESLVRHGFDRPLDYRRLHWSHWFRCESVHSLLQVPSKPGVFALAEEIADLGASKLGPGQNHVETAASPALSEVEGAVSRSEASGPTPGLPTLSAPTPSATVEERPFRAASSEQGAGALAPGSRRMLAVTQFFEDDDMAFVLDRMLSRENPLRARLLSGRYFIRFVTIDDPTQRRSICAALNQWMTNSAEKATGIGPHFATSLELTPATAESSAHVGTAASAVPRSLSETQGSGPGTNPALHPSTSIPTSPHLDSGAASNIHCPSPLPSGF
jgi:hypothetical protein